MIVVLLLVVLSVSSLNCGHANLLCCLHGPITACGLPEWPLQFGPSLLLMKWIPDSSDRTLGNVVSTGNSHTGYFSFRSESSSLLILSAFNSSASFARRTMSSALFLSAFPELADRFCLSSLFFSFKAWFSGVWTKLIMPSRRNCFRKVLSVKAFVKTSAMFCMPSTQRIIAPSWRTVSLSKAQHLQSPCACPWRWT